MNVQHSAVFVLFDRAHNQMWQEDRKLPVDPMSNPSRPENIKTPNSYKHRIVDKEEKGGGKEKITASSGLRDTWPLLYLVPRVLATHTSKPLSAKTNAKD